MTGIFGAKKPRCACASRHSAAAHNRSRSATVLGRIVSIVTRFFVFLAFGFAALFFLLGVGLATLLRFLLHFFFDALEFLLDLLPLRFQRVTARLQGLATIALRHFRDLPLRSRDAGLFLRRLLLLPHDTLNFTSRAISFPMRAFNFIADLRVKLRTEVAVHVHLALLCRMSRRLVAAFCQLLNHALKAIEAAFQIVIIAARFNLDARAA